ncbi:hypothetical protein CEXT_294861 [Caerostris extrusa]|uniref:Uncharacterized protein n=1 Tax=Caerostris extrusa TaxID=172846 RepID=A0AAV4PER2_CAEEX|nr:hypothetical protein CEXT_294861 [Caerostris extrusa]
MNAWNQGREPQPRRSFVPWGLFGFKLGFWLVCSLAKAVATQRPALLLIGMDRKVHSKLYLWLLSDVCVRFFKRSG